MEPLGTPFDRAIHLRFPLPLLFVFDWQIIDYKGLPLLTWINFNLSMDK